MAPRSRIARLRAPFVLTVASSALAGCGGRATDGDGNPHPEGPQQVSCPESQATGACEQEGMICPYGGGHVAECSDGTWQHSVVSVNPPIPDSTNPDPPDPDVEAPPTCPEQPPTFGSSCDHTEACEYHGPLCGESNAIAICRDGHWEVSHSTCNPPPVLSPCPQGEAALEEPCLDGDTCEAIQTEEFCGYGELRCEDGAWLVVYDACESDDPVR